MYSKLKVHFSSRLFPLYTALVLVILLGLTWIADQTAPSDRWRALVDKVNWLDTPRFGKCPAQCAPDPFLQPGMIHWPKEPGQINQTRWIPFSRLSEGEGVKLLKDVPAVDEIATLAWEGAVPDWTAQLNVGGELGGEWDWLRDRYVLFIDDRNNINQLCGEIHGEYTSWGGHTGGSCRIKALNSIIAHWFLLGMVDDEEYDSFRPSEPRPITFERRITEIMIPKMEQEGYTAPPDLVVMSSLFWDEALLRDFDQESVHRERPPRTGFFYNEIEWHRSRFGALVTFMRDLYGESIPLMLRTRHIRMNIANGEALDIFQLDQGCRAVAKEMGVRLFTWGDKLEGYAPYYDNDQHFPLGPNTYIFGDMTLYYLRLAALSSCWSCQSSDSVSVRIGGDKAS